MCMSSDVVVDSLGWIVFGGVAMTAAALERATGGQEIDLHPVEGDPIRR